MPEELFGLPLHPLVVHVPIVLTPLLALLVFAYVLVPPLRRHLGWLLMGLTVLVPATVYAARWSGDLLAEELGGANEAIADHAHYSEVLIWLVIALAPITWLFGALERGRRAAARRADAPAPAPYEDENGELVTPTAGTGDDPAGKGRRVVMTVLGAVMLGLAAVATYYLYEAGETGARMVWG